MPRLPSYTARARWCARAQVHGVLRRSRNALRATLAPLLPPPRPTASAVDGEGSSRGADVAAAGAGSAQVGVCGDADEAWAAHEREAAMELLISEELEAEVFPQIVAPLEALYSARYG